MASEKILQAKQQYVDELAAKLEKARTQATAEVLAKDEEIKIKYKN